MDTFKSLIQPLVGSAAGSSVIDSMKLVVLGGTVETARRASSSAWSHFVNSFFLTAHFSEEDYPYEWLMLWLSRRPEWQRSREFETTTRSSSGFGRATDNSFGDEEDDADGDDIPGRVKTRVVFQPTFDTMHTIFYGGHWLRVKRGRKSDGCEVLSISVVARNNTVLKQLVLEAKREFEAEAVHRIQIYFADLYGNWRWTDSRHKRTMGSIVLNPGVKEMLLNDARDFLKSEKWYADRGIPFRRGYLLHGVPGSGKSSLIHAIAGELMLDIYVVSLSSSWISDSTLTTLMGRVPPRCILLLEDLDAAFTRSVSRDKNSDGNPEGNNGGDNDQSDIPNGPPTASRSRKHQRDQLSEVNTLSLSGLLNALDGVAAAEGRLLFATTNHLERLDPALSRPGRMDVWIEFKNASKWQAEALFRNFFPSLEESTPSKGSTAPSDSEGDELQGIDVPSPSRTPSPCSSTLWSLSPSFASSSTSLSLSPKKNVNAKSRGQVLPQFGANNRAYLPPPIEEYITNNYHSAKPLDSVALALLAKKFADAIPQEEFSVAALQGYLLKHKSQPYTAANEAAEWVVSEREMRERLKAEKEKKEREDNEEKERRRKAREEQKKRLQESELERLKKELKDRDQRDRMRGGMLGSITTMAEEPFVVAVPTPPPEPLSISSAVADDDTNESESDDEDEIVLPVPPQLTSPDDWTAWMSHPLPTESAKCVER
ncbi:P-loop containing nucleoside triphosphate hydrolase protein [Desarmillaria ectypa]|nr:P-loop containing nucleoside triphosphate hydrolase protein [Desarmillaria ectypa]